MIIKIVRIAMNSFLMLVVGMVGFIAGVLTLGGYSPNMLLELISGETPQAKITTYLKAIQAQESEAALEAWLQPDPGSVTFVALSDRRIQITDELMALKITQFTIFEPEWWSTCCDPGITCNARNAGGARVRVQVLDAQGQPWQYIVDVFTKGPYFGDAEGNPYRHWLLRDVYPSSELPLVWTLSSPRGSCP